VDLERRILLFNLLQEESLTSVLARVLMFLAFLSTTPRQLLRPMGMSSKEHWYDFTPIPMGKTWAGNSKDSLSAKLIVRPTRRASENAHREYPRGAKNKFDQIHRLLLHQTRPVLQQCIIRSSHTVP
jgi:hypothetical protein